MLRWLGMKSRVLLQLLYRHCHNGIDTEFGKLDINSVNLKQVTILVHRLHDLTFGIFWRYCPCL